MTRLFQFLTIINLAGLMLFGFLWFNSKGPSQSAAPTATVSSPAAPSITPISASSANSPPPMTIANQAVVIKGEAGKPQTVDVLSGDAIDRNLYGDYDGKRVYFCHPGSKTRFESNMADNLQKVNEKGIVLANAPSK